MSTLESFNQTHRLLQVEGIAVTGFAAFYGEAVTQQGPLAGIIVAAVVGTVNATLEIYKYRKFERNIKR